MDQIEISSEKMEKVKKMADKVAETFEKVDKIIVELEKKKADKAQNALENMAIDR